MSSSMIMRGAALGLAAAVTACIPAVPGVPSAGYGAPYKGTGEGIYVKDSRNDWDITEGHHKIRSEQALEATGDAEYEARRQIAKDYNVRLYREGAEHRQRGHWMMGGGVGLTLVGAVIGLLIAPRLQVDSAVAATATMPESHTLRSGFASDAALNIGVGLITLGVAGVAYGYLGGKRSPPYYEWHTPTPLDRPAYVRQQTEPYNEKLGVSTVPDEDGNAPAVKPGARPPIKPGVHAAHLPAMRGGRR